MPRNLDSPNRTSGAAVRLIASAGASAVVALLALLPEATGQLPPAGLSTAPPATPREYSLDELTPEVLDTIFAAGRGYPPRASHRVDIQDLNACPEAGGSPLHELASLGGARSGSRGGVMKIDAVVHPATSRAGLRR